MSRSVIAIGLDAADPNLLEEWIRQGHLPTLAKLQIQGAYGRLKTFEYYRAETPWTTFLTGCEPQQTGYWAPLKFYPSNYSVEEVQAYDFSEYKPFYALLGNDRQVAVFDIPQSTLVKDVDGVQVLAWGAHSPMTPSHSQPESLYEEIISKHGNHPVLREDHAPVLDWELLKKLQQDLEVGISRKSKICQDLISQQPWDLFLTVFGETHSAGHSFWHLSREDHPLHSYVAHPDDDLMLSVFKAVDKAIGEILDKAPDDAVVVVFSAHGMDSNVMDLPSMVFLPEVLYRYNFPGKYGLAKGSTDKAPGIPIIDGKAKRGWIGKLWSLKYEENAFAHFLRRTIPRKVFEKLDFLFPKSDRPSFVSPFELEAEAHPLSFQPALWYQNFWPSMKAFAIPSFSEGYVRINLVGREDRGVVQPEDYAKTCDEIIAYLHQLKDARSGTKMVKEVIKTRLNPLDTDPKLPDADIVVIWQEKYVTDTIESPDLGRIGPVPYIRTGSHRSDGFITIAGPNIESGTALPIGHALDLAPTILELLNTEIPDFYPGKSIISKSKTLKMSNVGA